LFVLGEIMAETPEHRAYIEEFINRSGITYTKQIILVDGIWGTLSFHHDDDEIEVRFKILHHYNTIVKVIGKLPKTPNFYNQLSTMLDNFKMGETTDLNKDDLMLEELVTTDIEFQDNECFVCKRGTIHELPCGDVICERCLYDDLNDTFLHRQVSCGKCGQFIYYDVDEKCWFSS